MTDARPTIFANSFPAKILKSNNCIHTTSVHTFPSSFLYMSFGVYGSSRIVRSPKNRLRKLSRLLRGSRRYTERSKGRICGYAAKKPSAPTHDPKRRSPHRRSTNDIHRIQRTRTHKSS